MEEHQNKHPQSDEGVQENKERHKGLNYKSVLILISLMILNGGGWGFKTWNDPLNRLNRAIASNNETQIEEVYDLYIEGNEDLEKEAWKLLSTELDQLKRAFIQQDLSYEGAVSQLDYLARVEVVKGKADAIKKSITQLNDSRESFKSANDYLEEGQIMLAAEAFGKVISTDDLNYEEAKTQLTAIKDDYLKEVMAETDQLIKNEKYSQAIFQLNKSLKVYPRDPQLTNQKNKANTQLEEKEAREKAERAESYKRNQKMTVKSTYTKPAYPYQEAFVIVKNNTEKTVKKYTVGILMFDKEGKPVNNKYLSYGDGNLRKVNASSAMIKPGETYGSNNLWHIEGIANKIKACVMDVEFTDGTKWSNPYFEYWQEEEKNHY